MRMNLNKKERKKVRDNLNKKERKNLNKKEKKNEWI